MSGPTSVGVDRTPLLLLAVVTFVALCAGSGAAAENDLSLPVAAGVPAALAAATVLLGARALPRVPRPATLIGSSARFDRARRPMVGRLVSGRLKN